MRLGKAVQLFLSEYNNSGTRRAYQDCLMPLVDALGPDHPVDTIKPVDLVTYTQSFRQRDYRDATRLKHVKSIKTFFNWLIKIEILTTSPARALRQERLKSYVSRDKAMGENEFERVKDLAKWHPRDYALLLFLADTGCRAAGAAGLHVDDIDLENRRATVTEKGDKSRPVKFGKECARAIKQWMIKRRARGGYLFSRDGKALKPANISQIIRRLCKKAGVRSLGSHSLRHRKGHQLADKRIAPSVAATALGHENVIVTLKNYYPADFATAEQVLDELAYTPSETPVIQIDQIKRRTGTK